MALNLWNHSARVLPVVVVLPKRGVFVLTPRFPLAGRFKARVLPFDKLFPVHQRQFGRWKARRSWLATKAAGTGRAARAAICF